MGNMYVEYKPPPAIHMYYHSLMNALLASMSVSSNASGARWMPDHAGQQPAHYILVLHAAFFHSAHWSCIAICIFETEVHDTRMTLHHAWRCFTDAARVIARYSEGIAVCEAVMRLHVSDDSLEIVTSDVITWVVTAADGRVPCAMFHQADAPSHYQV